MTEVTLVTLFTGDTIANSENSIKNDGNNMTDMTNIKEGLVGQKDNSTTKIDIDTYKI